ncbi:protein GLUTAMINE DUMPER 5-like [Populus nigra]|uniref:protein GLUTAMINE DUMPER 5-like n=1 Tax=Populus nigra TaxID=3691 RepID=UPI002B26B516|nr:protein GLUTAMINE DUMPER 5-like [Populus nigra]
MRPVTNSIIVGGGVHWRFWQWNSLAAYLFVGLASMLGLVTVALIILSHSSSGTEAESDEKPAKQVDFEPEIVVIMAGDENRTYQNTKTPWCCLISSLSNS